MNLSTDQKTFNATAEGQRAMCTDAVSRSVVLLLNRKVRSLGGEAWDDKMIETASDQVLNSIREDLLPIYNKLVAA